jgi:hypothetical protein
MRIYCGEWAFCHAQNTVAQIPYGAANVNLKPVLHFSSPLSSLFRNLKGKGSLVLVVVVVVVAAVLFN